MFLPRCCANRKLARGTPNIVTVAIWSHVKVAYFVIFLYLDSFPNFIVNWLCLHLNSREIWLLPASFNCLLSFLNKTLNNVRALQEIFCNDLLVPTTLLIKLVEVKLEQVYPDNDATWIKRIKTFSGDCAVNNLPSSFQIKL